MKYSVAIIGGGIIGSSAAYFLARAGNDVSVAVIEKDSSYSNATTSQGAGGVRQQFSVEENIAQSTFSLEFYKHWEAHLADVPDLSDLKFREQGYLFAVTAEGEDTLLRNEALQRSMGVKTIVMDREELCRKFPSIDKKDIVKSIYTPDDGWIDPSAAMWGFRRAAEHHGAAYINGRATGMDTTKTKVMGVSLEDGRKIEADYVINCAGPWVNDIAKMTGTELPIAPMCRLQHFWECPHEFEDLPLVKDESGMFFRPEGSGFAGGRPSFDIEPGFVEDISSGFFANYFEDTVWPMLAALVPKFEDLRLQRSWGGHYAQNLLDGNMIIGTYSEGHDNLLTACGFSGHGVMHAPAVGRALSELVLNGGYQTIDLTRFGYDRVKRNEPLREMGIR